MFTLWLTAVLLLVGVLRYLQFKLQRRKFEKMVDKLPGPPAYPVIGNIQILLGSTTDIIKQFNQFTKQYGSPFRAWLLHKPLVMIFDPENFEIVAKKTTDKPDCYHLFAPILGGGLITANGSNWKRNRRNLNPAFNVTLLNNFFLNIFNTYGSILVSTLAQESRKTEIDLWPHVYKCTRDMTCMTAMGCEGNYEENITEYNTYIEKSCAYVTSRVFKPWIHPDIFFRLHNRITGYDKILQNARSWPLKILQKKKEEIKRNRDSGQTTPENEQKNFIDILLNSEVFRNITNKELVDEVVTFMLAGSETSAVNICFNLLMLAMHPKVQKSVHEELDTVFGNSNRPIEADDINQLPVLERCIQETLRRFAPAPNVLRKVQEDIKLKDGFIIPAGSVAALSIMKLHMNENIYKDAYNWNPDRFLPENVKKRHPASFQPFSSGTRSCIGQKYAMSVAKALLSIILREFQFSTEMKMSDIKLRYDFALRNVSGYHVRVTRRRKHESEHMDFLSFDADGDFIE